MVVAKIVIGCAARLISALRFALTQALLLTIARDHRIHLTMCFRAAAGALVAGALVAAASARALDRANHQRWRN